MIKMELEKGEGRQSTFFCFLCLVSSMKSKTQQKTGLCR